MPNTFYVQHSFNAGEVSDHALARLDQNKYLASCEIMENFDPLTLGGARRTVGTRFIAKAKFSGSGDNETVRMLRFVFSYTQAYAMEFGHLYARFFKENSISGLAEIVPTIPVSGNPQEVVTPFNDTDLDLLMPYQSGDVVYLPSGIYALQKLSRIGLNPDEFAFTAVNFDTPATVFDEPLGTELGNATLTPAATTGTGITFTASANAFLAGDVGRIIISGASRAVIVTFTSATSVNADIIDDFPDTNPIPAADWRLKLSPQTTLDPSGKRIGTVITMTLAADGWRSTDVGKYVSVYGGFVKIETFTSATVVSGTVKAELRDWTTDDDPNPTPFWNIEKVAWNSVDLYPTCGCFFQERMWLARGTRIWGSATGDFENFAKGSGADNAIARVISDDEVNPIRFIKGVGSSLIIGTTSGAYEARASGDKSLTPTDFNVRPVSEKGSARIQPVRISGLLVYLHASQRKLRELVFDFATDKFKSPNLLILADHLTETSRIIDVAYQEEPDSVIHCVREDGQILSLTYQSEENTIGWARKVTNGAFTSACCIPRILTGDHWLWVSVRRTINGVTETFIENFEPAAPDVQDTRTWIGLETHAASIKAPEANGLVDGLDYLEGETVRVIGDGLIFDDAVVTGGEITVTGPTAIVPSIVEIGLNYDSLIRLPEPIIPMDAGGPLMCRGYVEIGIRVKRTLGLWLGLKGHGQALGEQLFWRKPTHPMNTQVPLQRGKKCIPVVGSDSFNQIEIRQLLPLPAMILGTICKLHIGQASCCETVDDTEEVVPALELGAGGGGVIGCTDATFRGQQTISIEDRFDQQNSAPGLGTNLRTSWGYISATEEVYTLIGEATCAGGNMVYTATCVQINHFQTPAVLTHPSLISPSGLLPAINTRVGTSDEPIYAFYTGDASHFETYYPLLGTYVRLDGATPTAEGFSPNTFAKRGTNIFVEANESAFGPNRILEFDAVTGAFIQRIDTLAGYTVGTMCLTDDFLFCLVDDGGTDVSVKKMDPSDGSIIASFDLYGLNPNCIGVVNNNLIYVLCNGSTASLYYIKNFTDLVFVGRTEGQGFSPFSANGFFAGGAFYYGGTGFGGFSPDIFKITVACPDNVSAPLIASITRGAATVAAGASITVSWANVFEPDATDEIQLRPKPGAGELGFFGAPTSSQSADGLSSSSISFPIPSGTTPGDYVFMYVARGESFVAVSASFAVT